MTEATWLWGVLGLLAICAVWVAHRRPLADDPRPRSNLEMRVIPAGTVIHMQGMPVELVEDTKLRTHPANWKYALD